MIDLNQESILGEASTGSSLRSRGNIPDSTCGKSSEHGSFHENYIRFIDLFAGVGGFHKGLTSSPMAEQEGGFSSQRYGSGSEGIRRDGQSEAAFHCVWANEWDKYAAKVYRTRFPDTPLSTDDIRKVPADSVPDHDLLCAGFPCQAFSVAGKRRGLDEARGTLFYEIARIAEHKRPRLLLLENVKGLLSHDEGRTFATILRVMGSVGYRCEWQVLNSKWFGVPQNRERVFIVGHLGDEPTRTVFPITETGGESDIGDSGEQVANALQSPGHACGNYRGMNRVALSSTNPREPGGHHEYHLAEEVRTIPASNAGNNNPLIIEHKKITERSGEYGTGFKNDETVCLDSSSGRDQVLHQSQRIRRLTPVECERLQGFPDGWTAELSDTQRYKCMGNAVTVPVIRFLGERIRYESTQKSERRD